MANKDALFTSARTGEITRDEWQTPLWLYDLLDKEFHFELDPAATEENAMSRLYMDKEMDGLKHRWFSSVFVNPPYSQLKAWVKKGYEEARDNSSVKQVVMLVPARTDTAAWWQYIRFGEVRFLPGRLRFAGARNSAPFPSAVVIFHGGGYLYKPETIYWNVRESTHASPI